jgi:type I restriction enzyme S subunit
MSIAATVGLPIVTGIRACIHDGFVALERLRDVNQTFLLYMLKSLESDLRSAGQTGSQSNVNTDIVSDLPIVLPPMPEQVRIAAALSDADRVIATLERLISRKQAIKQGMMQQLLTGKTRLPGFTEPWRTTTIGDACTTFSGGTPSTAHADYYGGDIPWITSSDLNNHRLDAVTGRITQLGLERSAAKLVPARTPLIALYGATAGVAARTQFAGAINQAILAMVPRKIDAEFLFQWLSGNRRSIIDRYTQGGQPNLSGAIVRGVEVPLPDPIEQQMIGQALGEADDLIAALERRLDKAYAIKEGMMQQLLTGRARLPAAEGRA